MKLHAPTFDQRHAAETLRQTVARDLATLDDAELAQVAQFVSFLKFRRRMNHQPKAEPQECQTLYRDAFVEGDELTADVRDDVMLDAWCELPSPPPVATITPHRIDGQTTRLT